MSDHPEALRLADVLEGDHYYNVSVTAAAAELRRLHAECVQAAAELRRQHAEIAENESVINVWRGRTLRAEAERDESRAALQLLLTEAELADVRGYGWEVAIDAARAALKEAK